MKALPVLLLPLLALPAGAQSLVPGPNQPGRYEMQPVLGGVARLDTVTGDVSLCRVEDGALRCRPSEDEDASVLDRHSDLSGRDESTDRDTDRDSDDRAETDRRTERHDDGDADVDKAIRQMKKFFHAFGDIARDWDSERKGGEEGSGPDRT